MNTQDYIESIKQKNLEKAKWVLKMRFGDDLNRLKEFYSNRPFDLAWADLKTVIDVLESENLTNKHYAHLETITQNILGIIAGLIILRLFNIPFSDSIQLQVIFFVVSYIRSYCVRRMFSKLY